LDRNAELLYLQGICRNRTINKHRSLQSGAELFHFDVIGTKITFMRTTIDIPDELIRRAKATAALRGIKMNDLIADLLQTGLGQFGDIRPRQAGMNCPIPVTIPADGRQIPSLTNAQIFEILDREDDHGDSGLS
jgi:hypothetical protein